MTSLVGGLLLFAMVTNHASNGAAGETPAPSQGTVRLFGDVAAPYSADLNDLKKLPEKKFSNLPIVCRSGQEKTVFTRSRGVQLKTLLDRARPKIPGHFDRNHMYIVVSSDDGYHVIFSWNEIYNTDIGDDVVLIYELDGKPVPSREGPFVLVSGRDRASGPRHVRNTRSIEVRTMN